MQGTTLKKYLLFGSLFVLPSVGLGQAISVRVNGDPVAFPGVGPQQIGGRVLVPLRGVMEKLGAYVGYEPGTKTVTASRSGVDLTLRLGERSAIVNGRTVGLDVPAQEFHGSTMVPLRFVGEALGAEVRWNAATSTVDIATAAGGPAEDPNQYTPPQGGGGTPTGDVSISSFTAEPSGIVRAGGQVRMTLVGTPGGRASFSIPGVVQDVPMAEQQPGVYVGTFRAPEDNVNVTRANAIGRLVVNGKERLIQAGDAIGIDTQAPAITSVTPDPNSRVTRNRPNISATFEENSGSGVDPNSVELRLDNRVVTEDAQITPTFVSFRPDQPLASGRHDVTLTARDRAGNTVRKDWSFRVAASNEVIKSFSYDSEGQPLTPGTDITFTLVGEPGGKASFSVGDRVVNRPMNEVQPGKYVATYTIRRNDSFANTPVTARLVTAAGETFTVEANTAFNVNGVLEAPRITDPAPDTKVGSKVTFRGTAAPGSRVQIRIDYAKTALGVLNLTGTVAEFTVDADSRGNWVSEPVDMSTGLGGGSATYTVTAVTVGANGKTSKETVLKLRR